MESLTKLNPVYYKEIVDDTTGLKAFVVIDRNIAGRSAGGVRMAEDITLEEIANLAREMTLKYSFLNIKLDGAKSGIITPSLLSTAKRQTLCRAFGKSISSLVKEGKYYPSEDLGINSKDLSFILSEAKLKNTKNVSSEFFTALTVYLTIEEILRINNLDFKTQSVIIEGFGKVASETAKLLYKTNSKIIGISTIKGALFNSEGLNINDLIKLRDIHGDNLVNHYEKGERIDKEILFSKETDILIPGARPDSINNLTVDRIKAKFIIPIANIPATKEMEERLFLRGIIYLPGFVSNCGGVLGNFLSDHGFYKEEIEAIIKENFPAKLRQIIQMAIQSNISIPSLARRICEQNIEKAQAENNLSIFRKLTFKRISWLFYKQLLNIRCGFVLGHFAKLYIKEIIFY